MPVRLILNADDFGLTAGVNRAIGELAQAGALRSATMMANGAALADAVATVKANPALGVGCHVVLTDGIPVSEPETIPTLLGPTGRTFRSSLPAFVRDLLLGRVSEAEVEREALAQVRKLQALGIAVTHLDTHKHTHIFPVVARALARVAPRTTSGAMRNPFEPQALRPQAPLKRRLQMQALGFFRAEFERATAQTPKPDGTYGISATGDLNEQTLLGILAELPSAGTVEMLCHPGYNDASLSAVATRLRSEREVELRALLAIFENGLRPKGVELISYSELGKQ